MEKESWWDSWGGPVVFWVLVIWGAVYFFGGSDDNTPSVSEYESSTYSSTKSTGTNIHYDEDYEYNYRTGYSGSYEYNYDVEGSGDEGYVYGNVETSGKYGEGYIYNENGEEVYVETEWTDYGVLEAYDENGNWYELEVY